MRVRPRDLADRRLRTPASSKTPQKTKNQLSTTIRQTDINMEAL
ncbi:MAG: hypothetical protein ABSG95_14450 [Solirubrobacteraceae bacterium]|jgi:hypothetical protein